MIDISFKSSNIKNKRFTSNPSALWHGPCSGIQPRGVDGRPLRTTGAAPGTWISGTSMTPPGNPASSGQMKEELG